VVVSGDHTPSVSEQLDTVAPTATGDIDRESWLAGCILSGECGDCSLKGFPRRLPLHRGVVLFPVR
jgi:hypothetical protein